MAGQAKRIRLSEVDANLWQTLPGNTGEFRNEAGEIDDTIFGQNFNSSEAGLIGWQITANALYKGFAGYVATLKRQGTSTAMTDEAMTLVEGQTYAIDDTTKQIFNRGVALTVSDNGAAVDAADIESINYLFGEVTFASGYAVTGPVTLTGEYYPTIELCGANSFTLTQTSASTDTTDMCLAASNGGYRVHEYGLRTVSFELSGFYRSTYGNLAILNSRDTVIIELSPDGGGKTLARGFFRMTNNTLNGDVGNPEQESVTYQLNVPDENLLAEAFAWRHTDDSTLNQAVRLALDAWEQELEVDAQYLPNGTSGHQGRAIVTEMTLSGGLEAMNEFAVTLMGVGSTTEVNP